MKLLIITAAVASAIAATAFIKAPQYRVNENASRIHWKGSAKDRSHIGDFKVTGYLNAEGKRIQNGKFIIPIASIEDFDLPENIKPALLADLKSKNFFDIALHPNAEFALKQAKPIKHLKDSANYIVSGAFQMIGQTHSISFPAKIIMRHDTIVTEAKFNLDRTKWGMTIHTDPKGALYINPIVNIDLEILTTKN